MVEEVQDVKGLMFGFVIELDGFYVPPYGRCLV